MPFDTVLPPHVRGDTFRYSSTIGNGWTLADFTGGLKFTIRDAQPTSSETDDTGAVAQGSIAGGQITGAGTSITVELPDSSSTAWPVKILRWDIQGIVTTPRRVYTLDGGTILILPDVTRGQ